MRRDYAGQHSISRQEHVSIFKDNTSAPHSQTHMSQVIDQRSAFQEATKNMQEQFRKSINNNESFMHTQNNSGLIAPITDNRENIPVRRMSNQIEG